MKKGYIILISIVALILIILIILYQVNPPPEEKDNLDWDTIENYYESNIIENENGSKVIERDMSQGEFKQSMTFITDDDEKTYNLIHKTDYGGILKTQSIGGRSPSLLEVYCGVTQQKLFPGGNTNIEYDVGDTSFAAFGYKDYELITIEIIFVDSEDEEVGSCSITGPDSNDVKYTVE
jgi:hypothetical protein|tara:strand:- start:324 stop:860 length:537 start_codon:yes stop_codon:yes gene_type:complete